MNIPASTSKTASQLSCFTTRKFLAVHGPMAIGSAWSRLRAFRRPQSTIGKFSLYLFVYATWLPVAMFCFNNVIAVSSIKGASMYPFLNTEKDKTLRQDVVLNWKFNAQDSLARGMIIMFWYA
jgi:inner membrane protease subunit 2